jgi:hypothetical protein
LVEIGGGEKLSITLGNKKADGNACLGNLTEFLDTPFGGSYVEGCVVYMNEKGDKRRLGIHVKVSNFTNEFFVLFYSEFG